MNFNNSKPVPKNNKPKEKPYRCSFANCKGTFHRLIRLERHEKQHGTFKCKFCDVEIHFASRLAAHEMKHVSRKGRKHKKGMKCPRCPHRVGNSENYKEHFVKKHLGINIGRAFKCGICAEIFSYARAVERHTKICHGGNLTAELDLRGRNEMEKCNECSAYFLQKIDLLRHKYKMHGGTDYRLICIQCDRTFKTHNSLKNHLQMIHGSGFLNQGAKQPRNSTRKIKNMNFKKTASGSTSESQSRTWDCGKCPQIFRNAGELQRHQKLHGVFKCHFCEVTCEHASELALHESVHSTAEGKQEKFKCARCSFSPKTETVYVRHHLTKHLGLNLHIYQCDICEEGFYTELGANKHHESRHNRQGGSNSEEWEKCDQCPAYFTKKIYLVRHKRNKHSGVDYQVLECNLCSGNKKYRSRRGLQYHQKMMHGLGKSSTAFHYACDANNCKESFETNDELEWHKKFSMKHKCTESHSFQEKTVCETCGKECKGTSALKQHMRIHKKRKPTEFKCNQCEKSFKTKAQLQMHEEFHKDPNEWKYMCAICSRKCVTKQTLEAHMRSHTKEKPFVCQVCGEKYSWRHNLRKHVNSKHRDVGVEDIARKRPKRFFVSRKGKKLAKPNVAYSFISNTTSVATGDK